MQVFFCSLEDGVLDRFLPFDCRFFLLIKGELLHWLVREEWWAQILSSRRGSSDANGVGFRPTSFYQVERLQCLSWDGTNSAESIFYPWELNICTMDRMPDRGVDCIAWSLDDAVAAQIRVWQNREEALKCLYNF